MGQSNAEWGYLPDDEQREAWDSFEPLPAPGVNAPLDSFCKRKRIAIGDLVRVGARLSTPTVLAFAFPGGLKFRDIVTDQRWNYVGSTFDELKIIRSITATDPGHPADYVLVCEGETDAARLSAHYDGDVAVLPTGAMGWRDSYVQQLEGYERVYVATDADKAGDTGADRILAAIGRGQRFRPPAGDWCEVEGPLPPLPAAPEIPTGILVPALAVIELETPDEPSYFDNAILPLAGTLMLHGPYKSFKSWIALDLMAALAQGEAWALFEARQGPIRAAVLNFEIPLPYYQVRLREMRQQAKFRDEFDQNLLTYTPGIRPQLVAGDRKSEDPIIRNLLEAQAGVVLIDPVRRAIGFADPNAENEVRKMLRFAERLNDYGIAVVLVHHDNKEGDKYGGGDPRYMTGSGAWAGDVDGIVSLSLPRGEPRDTGTRRNLHFLLRNAQSPSSRGFELDGTRATYSLSPYDEDEKEGDVTF